MIHYIPKPDTATSYHDFPEDKLLKVAPYGVYVVNDNSAFVNLGTICDIGEFVVESISKWWDAVGQYSFSKAHKLLINCDCGGSNGVWCRLWKFGLQGFADRVGLDGLFRICLRVRRSGIRWSIGFFVLLVRIGLGGHLWMLSWWLV